MDDDIDRQAIEDRAGRTRIALIAQSHARLTGRALVPEMTSFKELADALWTLPAVVLAHGAQDDPVFFYGNRAALKRFAISSEGLIAMPSRLSAEPVARKERERLLARVAVDGYIDDYAGVRIDATGARFRIEQATVWNLVDVAGERHGQAATFSRWTEL